MFTSSRDPPRKPFHIEAVHTFTCQSSRAKSSRDERSCTCTCEPALPCSPYYRRCDKLTCLDPNQRMLRPTWGKGAIPPPSLKKVGEARQRGEPPRRDTSCRAHSSVQVLPPQDSPVPSGKSSPQCLALLDLSRRHASSFSTSGTATWGDIGLERGERLGRQETPNSDKVPLKVPIEAASMSGSARAHTPLQFSPPQETPASPLACPSSPLSNRGPLPLLQHLAPAPLALAAGAHQSASGAADIMLQ